MNSEGHKNRQNLVKLVIEYFLYIWMEDGPALRSRLRKLCENNATYSKLETLKNCWHHEDQDNKSTKEDLIAKLPEGLERRTVLRTYSLGKLHAELMKVDRFTYLWNRQVSLFPGFTENYFCLGETRGKGGQGAKPKPKRKKLTNAQRAKHVVWRASDEEKRRNPKPKARAPEGMLWDYKTGQWVSDDSFGGTTHRSRGSRRPAKISPTRTILLNRIISISLYHTPLNHHGTLPSALSF